jgi:hypothetical protein
MTTYKLSPLIMARHMMQSTAAQKVNARDTFSRSFAYPHDPLQTADWDWYQYVAAVGYYRQSVNHFYACRKAGLV